MDGTPHGGQADDAPTAPQPPLTPEVLAAMSAGGPVAHHHERTGHAHQAPGGVAPHPQPHHAAPEQPAPSSGRRRALLAAGAAVAALAVAGGAMAFAAGRGEPQAPGLVAASTTTGATGFAAAPPAASEAPGVTATAPMLPPAQDTLVLGDSLGLTVYPWLADLLPDRYVSYEAQVGRTTPATYEALRALRTIPPVVLVSSGTNDFSASAFEKDAGRILDLLGPERCVVWVDVVRPDRDWSSEADMNAALDRAVAGRSNVSVLRWTELLDQNPGWLGGDGIHPDRAGAEGRARAMAAASLACSPLDPDAPRARRQYVDPTAFSGPINPGTGTGAPSTTASPTRSARPSVAPTASATGSTSGTASASPSRTEPSPSDQSSSTSTQSSTSTTPTDTASSSP